MNKTFIFDLDDTILKNHHKYSFTQLEFVSYAIRNLGSKCPADAQEWINKEVEIDSELVKTMGYSSERFPLSLKKTYEHFCNKFGIKDWLGAEVVQQIGRHAFDEVYWKKSGLCGFIDGVEKTLDYLSEQNDELILLTKGDKQVQQKKIELYELDRWFGKIDEGRIKIVPEKNGSVIREVVESRNKDLVWHVGNLIKSDVIPGIDAGVKVLYIPYETWAHEKKHSGIPESDRVVTLNSISDIKNNYNSLFGN